MPYVCLSSHDGLPTLKLNGRCKKSIKDDDEKTNFAEYVEECEYTKRLARTRKQPTTNSSPPKKHKLNAVPSLTRETVRLLSSDQNGEELVRKSRLRQTRQSGSSHHDARSLRHQPTSTHIPTLKVNPIRSHSALLRNKSAVAPHLVRKPMIATYKEL